MLGLDVQLRIVHLLETKNSPLPRYTFSPGLSSRGVSSVTRNIVYALLEKEIAALHEATNQETAPVTTER